MCEVIAPQSPRSGVLRLGWTPLHRFGKDLFVPDEHISQTLYFSSVENREDILNASDKLTEVLEEANTLFNGGNSLFFIWELLL